jgi:REP-associated tyrosine transposase
MYFVTIRARDDSGVRFSRASGSAVRLNVAGRIVETCWLAIPDHFPSVQLDAFVIMPDHVHGILAIREGRDTSNVGAQHAAPLPLPVRPTNGCCGGVAPGSLGAIVRSFKSAVSKRVNELRRTPGAPVWQRNYFDRIIRDNGELNRVRWYIRTNPSRLTAAAKR